MERHSIQLILPSNSSMDVFPDNKVGNFKTKLPKEFNFQNHEMEVGLSEISYVKSWPILKKDQDIVLGGFKKHFTKDGVFLNLSPVVILKATPGLSAGHYHDKEHLVYAINKQLRSFNLSTPPNLYVNDASNRVYVRAGIDLNGDIVLPFFDYDLLNFLGLVEAYQGIFKEPTKGAELLKLPVEIMVKSAFHNRLLIENRLLDTKDKPLEGNRALDVSAGKHTLFVYCDILEPTIVGDKYAKLLRIVEVPTKASLGDLVTLKYDNPQYYPLSSKQFDTIEIDIKDTTDTTIPFDFGPSIVTLHIREKH